VNTAPLAKSFHSHAAERLARLDFVRRKGRGDYARKLTLDGNEGVLWTRTLGMRTHLEVDVVIGFRVASVHHLVERLAPGSISAQIPTLGVNLGDICPGRPWLPWEIDDPTEIARAVNEIAVIMEQRAVPWIKRSSSLDWVLTEFERHPRMPQSAMTTPAALYLLQRRKDALAALDSVEQGERVRLPPQFLDFATALRQLIETGDDPPR
jgi:hypothetical protein